MNTAAIEACYQRTYQYWEKNWKHHKKYPLPEPLSLKLPKELEDISIGAVGFFGDEYIDEKKLYYQCAGNKSEKIGAYSWPAIGFAGIWTFCILASPYFQHKLVFKNWIPVIISIGLYYLFRYLERTLTRKPCCIFDRENSLFYIYQGQNKPHLALNFYDQYYYITIGAIGALDYAHLWMKPRIRREDGTFDDSMDPRVILPTGNRKMAMAAWYSLLTYMNKERSFTQEELDFFEKRKAEKAKMGYKVEGIHFPDGTIEKF